jgi:Ca2+-binding RTX toxin-like protein
MTAIDTPFLVTGGETNRPPTNAYSANERQINIRAPFSVPSAQWTGEKVWLLIPGFTAPSDSFDATLATAINGANPNDTVLALDWTQVSGTPTNNAAAGILAGDLYRSGSWITPVATAVRDKLVEWGMPAAALNIVGHSLGAHLASELAASFNTTDGSQVGSVTALDPASNRAIIVSPYDRINGFDTDLSNGYLNNGGIADPIERLDFGATASRRSFNGISSVSGNEAQAGTARESFLFDFGTNPRNPLDLAAQHSRVVTAYTNLLTTDAGGNSRLATNILGLSDTQADHQFRPDFYRGDSVNSLQVHEGMIPVDAQDNPLFLVAAKLNGETNDRFIYATNGNDVLTGTGIFGEYYNNNGNHTYYFGDGDDIVSAGTGNDIILGGKGVDALGGSDGNNLIFGEEGDDFISAGTGDDTINGGAGDDYINAGNGRNTIRGDEGDDDLTGGNGINILYGGLRNDNLGGGAGQNILRGSESNGPSGVEVDTLIGNSGNSLNVFYIGDNTTNWYSVGGGNDYAQIVNFNAATDVILGGVNIEAQNLITQTFLWSGGELIAKIDGLWASQLQFPVRIF